MLKNILNLKGAQKLNKKEQAFINGGIMINCTSNNECPSGRVCSNSGYCFVPDCLANSDCNPGDICVNYNCQTC